MLMNDQMYVLLALRKDDELKQLFRQGTAERFNQSSRCSLAKIQSFRNRSRPKCVVMSNACIGKR